jgi:hypothetical protein
MRLKPTAKNTVGGKIFPEFFDYECEETPLEHERIPTHPRQDGAAKSLERYLSIRDEIRSADKKELAEHVWRSASHFAAVYFCLEGVSQAEIGLDKVVPRPIGEVIPNFAENPDMGSKAIFESAPNVAEHPIRSKVLA